MSFVSGLVFKIVFLILVEYLCLVYRLWRAFEREVAADDSCPWADVAAC